MPRYLIKTGSGDIRVVGDAALPFFPGRIILDTLDDNLPPTNYYDAATADFRYVNVTELSDPASPASVALKAAYGRPVSTDGTNSLPAPTGVGLEFVITATGLQDIRYNGTSL